MNTINTLNIFIFIVTFIISLLIIILYNLIKPQFTKPVYNFTPFPTIEPTNIPNDNIENNKSCSSKLYKCDPKFGCVTCTDGDDYECTPVSQSENVVVNGTKVEPGYWCLPKGKKELGCGTYTGRAIWSEQNGKQQWKCVCLYPDLFGGDNCLTQLACQDVSNPGYQSDNMLQNRKTGNIWNPNDPNFDPENTTPYDIDENGDPLYVCQCNQNKDESNKVKFVNLPGDPYRCHLEPCTPEHTLKMWNSETGLCDCTSNGLTSDQFVHSNVTGQCLNQSDFCTWDDDKNQCKKCGQNSVVATCESNTMKRNSYTDEPCPKNPGGSYCKFPCQGPGGQPYCENGGVGTIVDGKCKCQCINSGGACFSGDKCEKSCLLDGITVNDQNESYKCCSKKTRQEGECITGCNTIDPTFIWWTVCDGNTSCN